jgi:uncharacterized protein YkwD
MIAPTAAASGSVAIGCAGVGAWRADGRSGDRWGKRRTHRRIGVGRWCHGPLKFLPRTFKKVPPPSDGAWNQLRRSRRCRPRGSFRMSSIAPTSGPTPRRCARRWVSIALGLAALGTTVTFGTASTASAVAPAPDDWLGIVNVYRAQSGLAPVSENPTWSAGARNHSCWMLLNGIAHAETPGTPGYTVEGDQAGRSGNVAVSSNSSATPRSHIDLWMTGPFHAIGLLRSSLQQSAFGLCASPPNPTYTSWKSAATLDVVRGNVWERPSRRRRSSFQATARRPA